MYSAYSTRPNLILGFHGCDRTVRDQVISGNGVLRPSRNRHDWLGHGIYFWENNPSRAQTFAEELKDGKRKSSKGKVVDPCVIGAVIYLGKCLDLLDNRNIELVKLGHQILTETLATSDFPQNQGGDDKLRRELDCAVFQTLHTFIERRNPNESFDSVRAVFWEGEPIYPDAGFKEYNHIQICVRNPNCIKGYFIPRNTDIKYKEL